MKIVFHVIAARAIIKHETPDRASLVEGREMFQMISNL